MSVLFTSLFRHCWLASRFSLLPLLAAHLSVAQSVRYVTPMGAGTRDGTSWNNALAGASLQAALASAPVGTSVLVGAGLYKPTTTTNRLVTFSIPSGVKVYGGYEPGTTNRTTNPASTTLSGELGTTNNIDNSYHVVTFTNVSNQTLLDGFVITGGYANQNTINQSSENSGGGIRNAATAASSAGSNPVISNCQLIKNYAVYSGGGICNDAGGIGTVSPTITDCRFSQNTAAEGGGLSNFAFDGGTTNTVVLRCSFEQNAANLTGKGGGINNNAYNGGTAKVSLTDCVFTRNTSVAFGGALFNDGAQGTNQAKLVNCQFVANSATYGGAIYNFGYNGISSPVITNCSFLSNNAIITGGAICNDATNDGRSEPAITNSSFSANQASNGAAIYGTVQGTVPNFTSATNTGRVNSILINNSFFGNGSSTGATFGRGQAGIVLVTVSYSYLPIDAISYQNAGNNIISNVSPFVSATDLRLNACSLAIDTGINSVSGLSGVTTDLANNPRVYGSRIDMGAYEFQGTPNRPLAITTQPSASSTVATGTNLSIPVTLSGTASAYQWYKDGAQVSGQTGATLTLSDLQVAQSGSYSLGVTGPCNSVTSTAFSLRVDAPPVVTTSPGATQAGNSPPELRVQISVDVDHYLTLSDSDSPTLASASVRITTNFQPQEDQLSFLRFSSEDYGNITVSSGATAGELVFTSAGATATLAQWQTALRSATYKNIAFTPNTDPRIVSFVVNDGIASSAVATKTITVGNYSPSINGLAASPSPACAGLPLTFTATLGHVSGQDAYTLTNGSSTTTGTVGTTLNPSSAFQGSIVASGSGPQSFTLTVNSAGLVVSATASVSVIPALTITQQPTSSSTVIAGASVSVPVSVSGTVNAYQWYKDGTAVSGQTSATLNLSNLQPSQSGSYSLVATGNCNSVTSTAFSLQVIPTLVVQLVASSTAVCSGSPLNLSLVITNPTGTNYSFSLTTRGFKDIASLPGSTNTTILFGGTVVTVSAPTTFTITGTAIGVDKASFGQSASASVVFQVNPIPTLVTDQANSTGSTRCDVPNGRLGFTTNLPNGSYPINYVYAGKPQTQTVVVTNGQLALSGLAAGQYYGVSVTNGGCSGVASGTATVTAPTLPTVSITPSATAVCQGQSVQLTALGAATYVWSSGQSSPTISATTTGSYSVTGLASNGCSGTATASVTVNPLPTVYAVTGGGAYCQGGNGVAVTLSNSQIGVNYQLLRDGNPVSSPQPGSGNALVYGNLTVSGLYTILAINVSTSCQQLMSGSASVSITPLPDAPTLVTASGYPYPASQNALTINQNVGPVSLTVSGCNSGMLMANGNAASSFTISTAMTGTQTYTATCTQNGCTGPAASFQLTVIPTTLSVLHRDADYGNTSNNTIKPYLELANAGGQAIPYSDITVRYWFTSEGNAPPTNLAVYYAQLGAVNMKYIALSQPRQGAYGYVEYSFPGGGSLSGGNNSGPIENGIQKTDGSNFDESDDYSYQANYQDYISNSHITAYRNNADGVPVIIWGQEPTIVASQTAVQVYSQARDQTSTSQIQTRVELRNTGNVALPVANLKLRYYFTSDNGQLANVYVDYADIGASNVQVQVVKLASPVGGADSYVELSFPGNPMQVNALSSLGAIDFRLVRSDYGLFDQSNDYSFAPNYGNVGLNNRVTAYLNNTLIFGTPPLGAPARVIAVEPSLVLQARLLGNPVVGSSAEVEIKGVAGQAISLKLVDLQGRSIHEQRVEQAGEAERVSLPLGTNRGQLLLKVSTETQQQILKLLRP